MVSKTLRRYARRAAILGLQSIYRVSGATNRASAAPGATLVLLHNTPPSSLDRLLAFVDSRRDEITDFDTAVRRSTSQPSKPMISLTFDDGFESNIGAAEALAERGISACFYVPTGIVGERSQDRVNAFFRGRPGEGVLSWTDLERMTELGHVVGSHCVHHRPLSDASSAEAEDEIKASVAMLRERLGSCNHFAWPFGRVKHAPTAEVVFWCSEIGVVPASGIRGRNTNRTFSHWGYLLRDAVDIRWIRTDFDVFSARLYLAMQQELASKRSSIALGQQH